MLSRYTDTLISTNFRSKLAQHEMARDPGCLIRGVENTQLTLLFR